VVVFCGYWVFIILRVALYFRVVNKGMGIPKWVLLFESVGTGPPA
jgi:hypothetical protein